MNSILAFIILVAVVIEIMYAPRIDITSNKSLLIWYNTIDDRGNKVREFKQLI